jgi:hypothetical protein
MERTAVLGSRGVKAMTWNSDVQARKKRIQAVKALGNFQAGQTFWADLPLIVLHYDLITITPQGGSDPRTVTYPAVESFAKINGGIEMTESVYAIPLPAGWESEAFAVQFWNSMAARLKGVLKEGDTFYLLYSAKTLNLMGVIGEVVDTAKTSLTQKNLQSVTP